VNGVFFVYAIGSVGTDEGGAASAVSPFATSRSLATSFDAASLDASLTGAKESLHPASIESDKTARQVTTTW
jgi:hypothetical protein